MVYLSEIKEKFQKNWENDFSPLYLRTLLEFLIEELKNEYKLSFKNRLLISEKFDKIEKKVKKREDKTSHRIFKESKDLFMRTWKNASTFAHYSSTHNETIKEELEQLASEVYEVFTNMANAALYGVNIKEDFDVFLTHKRIEDDTESNKEELRETVLQLEQKIKEQFNQLTSTISKYKEENEKLKNDKEELRVNQDVLKELMKNDNKKSIEELKDTIRNLEHLSNKNSAIIKNAYMINRYMKRNINKQAFKNIIYGDNNYFSKKDLYEHLFGDKKDVNVDAIKVWEEYTDIVDNTFGKIDWTKYYSESATFVPSKNISGYISNDTYMRYDERNNIHSTFKIISHEKFTSLKNTNFVITDSYIKQDLEWALFNAWTKGIVRLVFVVVDKLTLDRHLFLHDNLSQLEGRFINYERVIRNKINNLLEEEVDG